MQHYSQAVAAKIISGSNNERCQAQTSPSLLTGSGNTVKADNGLHWSTSHDKVNNPYQNCSTEHAQQISVWIISWLNKSIWVFMSITTVHLVPLEKLSVKCCLFFLSHNFCLSEKNIGMQ